MIKIGKAIHEFLPHIDIKRCEGRIRDIPLLLQQYYRLQKVQINQTLFLVATIKDPNIGPRQIFQHEPVFKKKYNLPIVWLLEGLHYNKVKKLVEKGVNFLVVGMQCHLPALATSLRVQKPKMVLIAHEFLKPLAVNMVIRQILKADLDGLQKQDLAKQLHVNPMAISRAIKELEAFQLIVERKSGRSKIVHFVDRGALWDFLQTHGRSPVVKTIYLGQNIAKLTQAGISALASISLLADDKTPTAMAYKSEQQNFVAVDAEEASMRLELWDRKPVLVEKNRINMIDLYLSLQHSTDERVQIELSKVLAEAKLARKEV